ncbi:MAG: ethylbenzene dehydrogenase-related protein [Gammaproteobacteria bacterium]
MKNTILTNSIIGCVLALVLPISVSAEGFGLDWDKAPEREIYLLYPGQSSMEWALTGKDHGGARAFHKAGDRCFDCHAEEIEKMGELIVSGEKLEPTPIPDKPGSIPVSVKALHDADYLYLRFEWEESDHAPAPFVDGGKMDPDNQAKLAIMFATDDVEYAAQSGCWGTCHDDLKSMPGEADSKASKYLTESRTEVEIKGKGGKKRGGWDKRKADGDLTTEMKNGHFMDLLRYFPASGKTEDGHILADRMMSGGQGVEFKGGLDTGMWVIEMRRKLKSDKPGDISMALDKIYNMGFAIHDDYSAARFHHVSLGYKLGFDNDEAEINAVAK